MKYICSFLLLASVAMGAGAMPVDSLNDIVGRWDLTVNTGGHEMPSWLDIQLSGSRTLVGRFVGGGGSARPISRVFYSGGKINFSIPPQWEREDNELKVEGGLQGDSLVGTMVAPNGEQY